MRLIAHRGLMNGPDPSKENTVDQINLAIRSGFNVEIDVWSVGEQWFLGHDFPKYLIDIDFLKNPNMWIHCKNEEAFEEMTYQSPQLHYFWHQTDVYTLTSFNVPWIYPGKKLIKTGICVLPEENYEMSQLKTFDVYGFCSDYIADIKEILQ